jgi:hypothetical protein
MDEETEETPLKFYEVEFPTRVVVKLWAGSDEEALSEAAFELRELEELTAYQTANGNEIYSYVNPYVEGKVTGVIDGQNA